MAEQTTGSRAAVAGSVEEFVEVVKREGRRIVVVGRVVQSRQDAKGAVWVEVGFFGGSVSFRAPSGVLPVLLVSGVAVRAVVEVREFKGQMYPGACAWFGAA